MVIRTVNDYDESKGDITADAGRMYCCGVAELYGVYDNPVEKIEAAKQKARFALSVGLLLATTNPYQTAAVKNLQAAGFKLMMEVYNPRMGAKIKVWGCDVSNLKSDGKAHAWRGGSLAASAAAGGAKNVATQAPKEVGAVRGNVWVP